MAAVSNVAKIAEDLSHLKSDMVAINALVDRLGPTLDKLTEVSSNVSQLLAVHETKITSQEVIVRQTVDLVEKRRVETEEKIQKVHDRVSENEAKFAEKLDKQHQELMRELKLMQTSSATQHQQISQSLSNRIAKLERWVWTLIGAGIVIGTLVEKINFTGLFHG